MAPRGLSVGMAEVATMCGVGAWVLSETGLQRRGDVTLWLSDAARRWAP